MIGTRHSIISADSDSSLNLIGFGNRNISSIFIDKNKHQLYIQKTWSFFSDKIKILYESDDIVYFINSEKHICIANSKNQSNVKVPSDLLLDQAVMFSSIKSNHLYLIAECESDLVIFKISNNQIVDQRRITCGPIEAPICLRGNFCIVSTRDRILVICFNDYGETPYEIFNIKTEFKAIDVLGRNEDNDSLKLLGYRGSESEGQICIFKTSDNSIQQSISFRDSSFTQSKIEFGRFLCFSGT